MGIGDSSWIKHFFCDRSEAVFVMRDVSETNVALGHAIVHTGSLPAF
jgi:hypothetical protein